MKSVRNAKRLRARGMSRAFAVRGSGIASSTQRQREQLCNSMEISNGYDRHNHELYVYAEHRL